MAEYEAQLMIEPLPQPVADEPAELETAEPIELETVAPPNETGMAEATETVTAEVEQEHIVHAIPPTDTASKTETVNSYEPQEEQHKYVTDHAIPKQEADGDAVEKLQQQLSNVTTELASVHADLLMSEGKEEALENEITSLKETVRRAESGILQLSKENEKFRTTVGECTKENESLEEKLTSVQKELVEQKRQILEAITQETEATFQRHKEEAEVSDNAAYKEHVDKLEGEIASLRKDQRRQSVSYDATVRNLQKRISSLKHESNRTASIQQSAVKHTRPPESSSCTII